MTADWALHVRDRSGDRVCRVTDFTSAQLIPRFNAVGGWLIEGIPMASRAGQALVPGASIEAVRDGETILAGPLTWPTFAWSDAGYLLNASGVDWNLLLAGRLCYPAAPSTDLNAAYSDDRSGVAETVMREYVDVNVGGSAASERQGGVALAVDLLRGDPVAYSARLDVLLAVLQELATNAAPTGIGLGFRISSVDPDVVGDPLEFQVYEPTDRTSTAQFSPTRRNVAAITYDRKMADVNHIVVAGGGEGVLRTFVELDASASQTTWGLRLEGFRDQRQTIVVDELVQAGQEELAQRGDQYALTVQPADTAALTYGDTPTGYVLGDKVRVLLDGATVDELVREVTFQLGPDGGETITPVVGTPGAVQAGSTAEAALALVFSQQQALALQLGRLERAL